MVVVSRQVLLDKGQNNFKVSRNFLEHIFLRANLPFLARSNLPLIARSNLPLIVRSGFSHHLFAGPVTMVMSLATK